MNEMNRIIFSKSDFRSEDEMWQRIGQQIRLLLETNNVIIGYVQDTKFGIIVIEYLHNDETQAKPYWLYADEAAVAKRYHDEAELDFHKKMVVSLTKSLKETEPEDEPVQIPDDVAKA